MFKNFIVLAYRHFIRSPLSSFIELFGMTAGLTVFLLVLLWVDHETSFDQFNEKADRIYRLESDWEGENFCVYPTIVAPLLKDNLPEVEKAVRFQVYGNDNEKMYTVDDKSIKNYYNTGQQIYADNDFFDTFSFDFVAGDQKKSLAEKNNVVLTESLAKTIFDNENPIGKLLSDKWLVTGVIKDVSNFHIPFKMLRSFESLVEHPGYSKDPGLATWKGFRHPTYLLVQPNHNTRFLEQKISKIMWEHFPDKWKEKSSADFHNHLRPLKDIYFNGGAVKENNLARHGDRKKIAAYVSIAFFTLLLACVNFVNLNSAKCLERTKEVGIKKVSGASRENVFTQFLGEVLLLCFISMVLALIFTHSVLPAINHLIGSQLSLTQLLKPFILLAMIMGLILISLASGGLPALYISSFQIVTAIKGLPTQSKKGYNPKLISLTIQFIIIIVLIIGSITAFRQIHYMKNMDLAFGKNNDTLITFSLWDLTVAKKDVVMNRLSNHPSIKDISLAGAWAVPGTNRSASKDPLYFKFEGVKHKLPVLLMDENYLKTLDLELLQGRFFKKGPVDKFDSTSRTRSLVLNESAVKAIGLENPIGAIGKLGTTNYKVVGVLKDFHINSVNHRIEPMCFIKANVRSAIVKINADNIPATIQFIETEVEKITGEKRAVSFIDQMYQNQYSEDNNFASLIGYLTAMAILIACLGLLGVATHAIKLRIKEIGIRKTMGASTLQILNLITLPFVKVIILSSVLAIPIAWVAMQGWLDNYPYRTDLPWWVFTVACGLTVFVAGFTVIWQSWRASSMNPARLIRYE
ncbi:MAG: ABC transporter permease [Cyclobacteriaceae bacterium]